MTFASREGCNRQDMSTIDMSFLQNALARFRRTWEWLNRWRRIRRDVEILQARVAELQASAPPRPQDLKLIHSIYWGRFGDEPKRNPYCPVCVAKEQYVPLPRSDRYASGRPRNDGMVWFECHNCGFWRELTVDQEKEGLAG